MNKKLFLAFTLLILSQALFAQKFLVLDKYGTKRTKLIEGDQIYFKQLNNKALFRDYIGTLKDTSLILQSTQFEMPLNEFDSFYFRRDGLMYLSYSTHIMTGGFLFAAAMHPLISNAQYDAKESAIIGVSFFAFGQILKLFKWNKFRINKNGRVRIIDTTFRK